MINNIVLVGRTTKEIELKETKNGKKYAPFILAVNRPFKDEQADFIHCIAWNKTAETVAQYVSKGMMIGIEGRLQVRSYEDEAGVRQYISEVLVHRFTFLESKKSSTTMEISATNVNPFDPNFSHSHYHQQAMPNYDNPFATATTLAGIITAHQNTGLIDEELAF